MKAIAALAKQRGITKDQLHEAVKKAAGVEHIQDLPPEAISDLAWEAEVLTAEAE